MLRHFLGIASLPKDEVFFILDNADKFLEISRRDIKKVPSLRGKSIAAIFDDSFPQIHRNSFKIAAQRLSADYLELDTAMPEGLAALEAMSVDIILLQCVDEEQLVAWAESLQSASLVNVGDGQNDSPQIALASILTLMEHFRGSANLIGKKVALANESALKSLIAAHQYIESELCSDEAEVLYLNPEANQDQKAGAIVLSTNPYKNVGSAIDCEHNLIAKQITNEIAVNMALLFLLATGRREERIDDFN